MAHIDYVEDGYGAGEVDDRGTRPAAAPRLGTLVNWAGALMSLGLVIGMGVWAFQLMIRDVSGVPVIEALEGPMREPPADPGGTQAPHQGLAVNRIAEGEEAQPVPDRLGARAAADRIAGRAVRDRGGDRCRSRAAQRGWRPTRPTPRRGRRRCS